MTGSLEASTTSRITAAAGEVVRSEDEQPKAGRISSTIETADALLLEYNSDRTLFDSVANGSEEVRGNILRTIEHTNRALRWLNGAVSSLSERKSPNLASNGIATCRSYIDRANTDYESLGLSELGGILLALNSLETARGHFVSACKACIGGDTDGRESGRAPARLEKLPEAAEEELRETVRHLELASEKLLEAISPFCSKPEE